MEKFAVIWKRGEAMKREVRQVDGICELSRAYRKNDKRRNRILTATIALAILLIYCAFSIVSGKMEADSLLYARSVGRISSTYLENGSKTQYEQMKNLSYIKTVGINQSVGEIKTKNTFGGSLEYLDTDAYEIMVKPAYSDIHGSYPKKENEVMLPIRYLKEMGIKHPQIGMKLVFQIRNEGNIDWEECERIPFIEKEMILSGYYTDYQEPLYYSPRVYVSRAYLETYHISLFPSYELLILQQDSYRAEEVEELLYRDVKMENESQQFEVENTYSRQSMEDLFGNYLVMACCGIIVMVSAFLLIYNVVYIAARREIRQYGLLKTIGCTSRQLREMMFRQNGYSLFLGSVIGAVVGVIFVRVLLPESLGRLFMDGKRDADTIGAFYPQYLITAVFAVGLITLLAVNLAVRKVVSMSAVEGFHYIDQKPAKAKNQKRRAIFLQGRFFDRLQDRFSLTTMAWRNIKRLPKKCVIIVLSLFVGYTSALGAVVITTGTDATNDFLQNPDFNIDTNIEPHIISDKIPKEFSDNTEVISGDIVQKLTKLDGVKEVNLSKGGYVVIHSDQESAMQPKVKSQKGEETRTEDFATLQIVDEDYINKLESYVKKSGLDVDFHSFRNGEGVFLLHHHELSPELETQAQKETGNLITFYSLDSVGNHRDRKLGTMKLSGYMDLKPKHFPSLQMTANGTGINYFLISEQGFKNLGMKEKYFALALNVDSKKEPQIKRKLNQMITNVNRTLKEWDQLGMFSNSELLASAQDYITAANMLLGTLSLVLLFIGIMNYFNTIMTNVEVRKQELAVMESIGMTGKQLRKLLILEGFWYLGIVFLLEATVGYGILWVMGNSIHKKLLYFKFYYPWEYFSILLCLLLIVSLMIAEYMYRKVSKGSVTQRLRDY